MTKQEYLTAETGEPRPEASRVADAVGGLCLLLGLVVLFGWQTHNLRLLHIVPGWVAMAYNTALGFTLGGAGLLAAPRASRKRFAFGLLLVAAAYNLLAGVFTLAEYASGVSFGIDQLFMRAYTQSGVTYPGRPSVCAALCLALSGLALLVSQARGAAGRREVLIALAGALIAGLGVIGLSGYWTGIFLAYAWGPLTRMAVHTALGFMALGTGFVALAWRESRDPAPRWLPLPVGVASATLTLCLWQALLVQQGAKQDLIRRLEAATPGIQTQPLLTTERRLTNGELVAGLLLSLLLGGAVFLAQTARRAQDELETRVDERTYELAESTQALHERTAELEVRTDQVARANIALREVLLSVTEGRFHLCESERDLPPQLREGDSHLMPLSGGEGLCALRHAARVMAAKCLLPPPEAQDLETAVGEAGMNTVTHGGGGRGRVCGDLTAGVVQVWLQDNGMGISMEHLPRATLDRGYTTAGTLGHGFWLMLQTVDRLWLLTGPTGTTIVLEKQREPSEPPWLRRLQEFSAPPQEAPSSM